MITIADIVANAIWQKKEVLLKMRDDVTDETNELFICPYVAGEDLLSYEFVWGYLPDHTTFCKVLLKEVNEAEIIEIPFVVLPNACYQYSRADLLNHIVEGFDNIHVDAAREQKE